MEGLLYRETQNPCQKKITFLCPLNKSYFGNLKATFFYLKSLQTKKIKVIGKKSNDFDRSPKGTRFSKNNR